TMSTYGQYPPRPSPRPAVLPWLFFFFALGILIWRLWPHDVPLLNPDAPLKPVVARGNLAEDEQTTIDIYKRTRKSVVYITTFSGRRDVFSTQDVPEGTGSGFIWDENGHIVTNYHVIRGARSAQVTLADKRSEEHTSELQSL